MRERGSNTARQPRKGGGGSPDSVAIGRDSVAIGRADVEDKAQRRQNVAKNGIDLGA